MKCMTVKELGDLLEQMSKNIDTDDDKENIKTTKTGAELRIISIEKPTEDAVAVEKNLEDAFLFYFGEKSEEKQDA